MLDWDIVVEYRIVPFLHVQLKFVDRLQHLLDVSRVRIVSLSSPLSSGKKLSDLLVALHASVSQGHASPSVHALVVEISSLQFRILDIEGKMCIKLVFADSRPWTLCFTHANVQKAKLVPDHAMDLRHYSIVPIISAVSVESHAPCKVDSRGDECREGASNYASTHRDLSQ